MCHTLPLRVDFLISLTPLSHETPRVLALHTDNFSHQVRLHSQDLSQQAYPRVSVLTRSHESSQARHDTPNLAQHVRDQNFQSLHQ